VSHPALNADPSRSTSNPKEGRAGKLDPVLVLALDGATFDVIRPLVEAGELPNLGAWMERGDSSRLPSTTPPVTFPAWSSFMTGREPSEHGIFDFTQKSEGAYRLRFVNSTDRRAPSIFRRVSDAGGRVLVLGMPATHPPEPVNGLLVCGFDAPVSTGTDERSASDPALYRAIAAKAGPWMRPELNESSRADDFHERAVSTLLSRIDRKRDFALEAMEQMKARDSGEMPAFTMIVFSESDTAGHHYFRDHDPESPRHDPQASPSRRHALAEVYRRLDAACEQIRKAAGPNINCVVLSDHGMGTASDKIIHLNRYLAEKHFLVRRDGLGRYVDRVARQARDLALAWLPAALAQQLFRRARAAAAELESRARFGGLDWSRTLAFSEEANTHPGIWINLAGREAEGCVQAEDYESVRSRVIAALLEWRLPNGQPVVARALRREEVHRGPFANRAPDIVLELALDGRHGLSLVPTPWSEGGAQGAGIPSVRVLEAADYAGGRGRGMNGTHRNEGVWIQDGPHRAAKPAPDRLATVAPWLTQAMGLAWNDSGPSKSGASTDESGPAPIPYEEHEEEMVAERLRALGYLE
jgi:predicted AlkP superfamily phosphohydrolase/phosphomutase